MNAGAMARRCPRSKALGLARLERHRLAVMREGWLTAVRDPRSAVHGVLWDLALADVAALDRYEGVPQGLYAKLMQAVIAETRAEAGDRLFRRQRGAGRAASRLHGGRPRRGALMAAAGGGPPGAGENGAEVGAARGLTGPTGLAHKFTRVHDFNRARFRATARARIRASATRRWSVPIIESWYLPRFCATL